MQAVSDLIGRFLNSFLIYVHPSFLHCCMQNVFSCKFLPLREKVQLLYGREVYGTGSCHQVCQPQSPLSHSVLPCIVSKGFEVRLTPFDTEHSSLWKLFLFFTAGNPEKIPNLNKAFVYLSSTNSKYVDKWHHLKNLTEPKNFLCHFHKKNCNSFIGHGYMGSR